MERIDSRGASPTVSVIITCYNQGGFIAQAIQSLLQQTYQNIEIVVVDDGSTDETSEVVLSFVEVNYVYQHNAGLSAARNKGVERSTGSFIVFLDADDWLYENAIKINLEYLLQNPPCAFVSGWHDKVDESGQPLDDQDDQEVVTDNHYLRLLWGNYIGMHATVMYQRWVFDEFHFDASLKACEDYDIYFKIARKYPVACHSQKLAAYRFHENNMSSNIALMLKYVLKVCNRQRPVLKNKEEREGYRQGLKIWGDYYAEKLYKSLYNDIRKTSHWPTSQELTILAKSKPLKCLTWLAKKTNHNSGQWLREQLPDFILKLLNWKRFNASYIPQGKIEAGDFNRLTPFSHDFGFDRGGPIDRFYIENFLYENSNSIQGTVLEIGDNEYTIKHGGDAVTQSDILHIDCSNSKATFIGDITHVPQIPSGYFDCIIFTQTLHLIYDFKSALQTCYRILKSGGCLLLTVPGISQIDQGAWKDYWMWSFTDVSMRRLMAETFNGSSVDIKTYGNVYVAAAFLYGMGLPEFREDALLYNDPGYQVIISVKAVKH